MLRFWTMLAPYHAQVWNGAEVDLLLFKDGRRLGVECKRVDAPQLTPSMRNALNDLGLDHQVIIYPGARAYPLAERVTVLPLTQPAHGGRAEIVAGGHPIPSSTAGANAERVGSLRSFY